MARPRINVRPEAHIIQEWRDQDSNLGRLSQRIYSPPRLTAPESRQTRLSLALSAWNRGAARAKTRRNQARPALAEAAAGIHDDAPATKRRAAAAPREAPRASSACGSRSGGSARA